MAFKEINWHKISVLSLVEPGAVFVIYGSAKLPKGVVPDTILTKKEQTAAKKMNGALRGAWMASHVYLRLLAAKYLQCEPVEVVFAISENGKPYIPGTPFWFNLSHTDYTFCIGFSWQGELGTDLEEIPYDADLELVADYSFSPVENRYCEDGRHAEHFAEIWTLKEGLLKATGIGLVDNLNDLNTIGAENNRITEQGFKFVTVVTPNDEALSVVASEPLESLQFFDISAGCEL